MQAIDTLTPIYGRTRNIANAIDYVRSFMFTSLAGDRPSNPNILVLLVRGRSSDQAATLAAADRARRAGIYVIAVGLGNYLNVYELDNIASQPRAQNSLKFARVDDVSSRSVLLLMYNLVCTSENLFLFFSKQYLLILTYSMQYARNDLHLDR